MTVPHIYIEEKYCKLIFSYGLLENQQIRKTCITMDNVPLETASNTTSVHMWVGLCYVTGFTAFSQ